ncbi:YrzI family protein [Bacillus cereus]|nr:YrzI family small protein [Bacillus cereus]PER07040.1 YrzI family protein [Bacillus cereus]PEX39460.1 YrzI family protein [Bacillus cereus]PEZ86975.1 YrzI family protein [Bacillus cereus]PFF02718.1 YrzI family protein [Bacillus cereus]PFQ54130.1 YrzI family protein [Bacillus cereus]
MTISVLFLSITIQRNIISKEEILHNEQIEKAMNDVKERQALYCDHL